MLARHVRGGAVLAVLLVLHARLAPDPAEEVELEPDRRHTLYFKKPGYRSELVVLEPGPEDAEPRLEPAEVEVRLRPREEAPLPSP